MPLLEAIRAGRWKLHIAKSRGWDKKKQGPFAPKLYDLVADPGEQRDVLDAHPEVVERLEGLLETIDGEIERHARPVGRAT